MGAVSYSPSIVTMALLLAMALSCIISEISEILVENSNFFIPPCIRRPRWGVPVGVVPWRFVRKTRIAWLLGSEKILKICLFVSTECTDVTDRQTDVYTPHDDIGRADASHHAAKRLVRKERTLTHYNFTFYLKTITYSVEKYSRANLRR